MLVFAPSSAATKKLRLEAIVSEGGLTGPTPTQLRWSPDGRLLTYILQRDDRDKRDLWAIDRISGENRVLVTNEKLATLAPAAKQATKDERERERRMRYSVASYLWSPDSQSILFTSSGQLYLYDLAAEKARPLAPGKRGVRNPRFSPHGRWVSFLYDHDIWLVPPSGGEERRLTWGATDTLFHGDLDWVYPEEFAIRSGYEWSPDGRRLAFLEIDQSLVPTYPIPNLLDLAATVDLQRYPKPGDPNPRVRVGIIEVKPGASGKPRIEWVNRRGEYIPRMAWASNDFVAVQLLNRPQNELKMIFADARNGRSRTVLVEKDTYWINVTNDLNFLKESKELLWTSERTGFRHIYLWGYDGHRRRPLTEGPWEVSKIVGVDAENGWVYYLANEENPLGNDLYRIKLDGDGKERLTNGKGSHSILMNAPQERLRRYAFHPHDGAGNRRAGPEQRHHDACPSLLDARRIRSRKAGTCRAEILRWRFGSRNADQAAADGRQPALSRADVRLWRTPCTDHPRCLGAALPFPSIFGAKGLRGRLCRRPCLVSTRTSLRGCYTRKLWSDGAGRSTGSRQVFAVSGLRRPGANRNLGMEWRRLQHLLRSHP